MTSEIDDDFIDSINKVMGRDEDPKQRSAELSEEERQFIHGRGVTDYAKDGNGKDTTKAISGNGEGGVEEEELRLAREKIASH